MAFAKPLRSSIALLACCALPATSFGQSELNNGPLVHAYSQAQVNDPTFSAAHEQLQAGLESKAVAQAFLRPRVDLVGNVSGVYQDVSSDFFGGFDETYIGWAAQLQVTGPLWHRELKSILSRGENQKTLAQTEFVLAGQLLVQRLINAYFDLLTARAELNYANGEVKSVTQELSQTRARYQAGAIARTGLDEANARTDLAKAAVIDAKTLVDNAEDALLEIIGPENSYLLATLPDVPSNLSPKTPQPADLGSWLERARRGNLQVLLARQQELLQLDEINIARADLSPRLDYSGQLGISDQSQSQVGQERYANEIGIQLTVPIYAGGATRTNIRVAEANRSTAAANARRIQARVQLDTRRAFRQIESLEQRDMALARAIRSAESALRATRDGYRAGSRIIGDVLDAKVRLLAARRDAAIVRYDYLRSAITLQQLVGELGPQELYRLDRQLSTTPSEPMAQLPEAASKITTKLSGEQPFTLELQRNR